MKEIIEKENDEIIWDYDGYKQFTIDGYYQSDWNFTLLTSINMASAKIFKRTNIAGGDRIYVNEKLFNLIKTLKFFVEPENGLTIFEGDCDYVGRLSARYSVHVKNYIDEDTILVFNKTNLEKCVVKVINY